MANAIKVVPRFAWSAASRWRPTAASFIVLTIGLVLFGVGDALLVKARLGNSPWTVLAAGVAKHTPLDVGVATIVISFLVLVAWIPIGERPGLGTIANAIIVGGTIELSLPLLPEPEPLVLRVLMVVCGIAVVGIGGALYLSTHHGPGPRDGWMTGLAKKLSKPLSRVRIVIELCALAVVRYWEAGSGSAPSRSPSESVTRWRSRYRCSLVCTHRCPSPRELSASGARGTFSTIPSSRRFLLTSESG